MITTAIINLKGGVGKTITTLNLAYCLAEKYDFRVLLIDNDKQANLTKFFGLHDNESSGISDILMDAKKAEAVIKKTQYSNIDVITANMSLIDTNTKIILDSTSPQQSRLRKALDAVKDKYDICIVDNAPDINISIVNALVAADNVILPVKIDGFTFDGMDIMLKQIDSIRENFNPELEVLGCLITNYKNTNVNNQGEDFLKSAPRYKMMNTKIKWSDKVNESTFAREPLYLYSRRSAATHGYVALAEEYKAKAMKRNG